MSKKTNTLLFILGATVFNILVTVICFILLLVLYTRIIMLANGSPETTAAWGIPVIFIGAIVLSFFIYRLILKQLMKKINMDKYFDPIFVPRRPPRKNTD